MYQASLQFAGSSYRGRHPRARAKASLRNGVTAAEALYMGVSGEFYFISLRTWSPALTMNTPLPAKRISEFARPSATRLPAAL